MKKILIPIVIVLLLLLLGGGFYLYKSHSLSNKPTMMGSNPSTSTVFSSIQDALNRSLSLKCEYTLDDVDTIAYIKNGEIRSDMMSSKNPEANGSVIIKSKDKKIYYWNGKTGFVMTMPDNTITVTPQAGQAGSTTAQNSMNDLEKFKSNCKVADVANSLFVLPTDVKFTDESEMMKQVMPTAASGSNPSTGGYAIPTQYQQYMPR